MKNTVCRLMVIALMSTVLASPGWAGDASYPLISLRSVGDVAPDLLSRVASWVTANIGQVTNEGTLKSKGKTLDAIVKAVPHPPKDALTLVLVNELKGETRHLASRGNVVALNLGVMRLPDMTTDTARETFARRVEKESVGALAAALGLPVCPMIRCALYAAENTIELDEKSRGLCPPCMQKLDELKAKHR